MYLKKITLIVIIGIISSFKEWSGKIKDLKKKKVKIESKLKALVENHIEIDKQEQAVNDVVPSSGALYPINFVHEDLKPERIFLAYFPEQGTDSAAHAIGILSGYKDKNTKAGYFLIPLAFIADVAIVAVVIAGAFA